MNIWKRLTTRQPNRADLIAALRANTSHEDTLVRGRGYGDDVNAQVAEVLDLRDQRVAILRQLRWDREADELAADTAMRRSWPPIDTTPLTWPGGEA
jgi:hypothetical protein